MFVSRYQVGGSLNSDDPNYVFRKADLEIYDALKQGKFCSVLEAHQMGKSSLLIRTKTSLSTEGFCCVALNLSSLSGKNVSSECWYKGLLFQICLELNIVQVIQFETWWKQHKIITPIQRFHQLIREILTIYFPQKHLLFFIDEVDSVLDLPFSVEDFFSLIRFYYNQREITSEYNRLTFAVFGVATPSDLVKNSFQSPFSIGTEIKLSGFKRTEVKPLIQGFVGKVSQPQILLEEILFWTAGQPFLTVKLCQMIWNISQQNPDKKLIVTPEKKALWIENIVKDGLIKYWEINDDPEHLQTIQNRLLHPHQKTQKILKIYYKILQDLQVEFNQSPEHTELILSGLVIKYQRVLKVKNSIYRHVFNLSWVQEKLTHFQDLENSSAFKTSSFSSS